MDAACHHQHGQPDGDGGGGCLGAGGGPVLWCVTDKNPSRPGHKHLNVSARTLLDMTGRQQSGPW